jgi:transcriptional regulator with XRE-family HTH domain
MKLHEKIWREMARRNLNQQKLARLANVSDSEISRILAGKSNPSLEYARRIALAIEVSLDYLANDSMEEDAPEQHGPTLDPVEIEVLELTGSLGPRQTRRILETAVDLGYDIAIRRLLGTEMKPVIEVGHPSQTIPTPEAPSSLHQSSPRSTSSASVG